MGEIFMCSLCRNGILGGVLYLNPQTLTYRTDKLTVDSRYRNLVLPMDEIKALTWKRILFHVATFHMEDGEKYTMIIFNKAKFVRCYEEYKRQ